MPLKLQKTNVRNTATNKVEGLTITYTFDQDENGKVISMQAHAANEDPVRVSAHYDPAGKGLHIGIYGADEFDPKVFSAVARDVIKIIKKELL